MQDRTNARATCIEWMEKAAKQEVGFEQVEEMVDATGNEVKIGIVLRFNSVTKCEVFYHNL